MENIGSLIFIIIIINIISAIMRAIKGGKQKSSQEVQQAAVSPPPLPRSKIKLWVDDDEVEEEYDREYELQEFHQAADTSFAEPDDQVRPDELQAEEYVLPLRKKSKAAVQTARPLIKETGTERTSPKSVSDLFKDKDSFVTAFILHEILEPPVTRRKRRTI